MNTIEQTLFDSYAASVLDELDRFPSKELVGLLNSLPLEESRRGDLYGQARRLYFQWSADAFAVGLHLGLSLLNDNVCRLRPEKG